MTLVRCTRCVMPTSRPDSQFIGGICTACLNYEARAKIDWASRREELARILESAKPNIDGFAVAVPSSGGKDSHSQVLTLIEMGVRPLVITATTCMPTLIGRKNIDNLARHATTIEVSPNKTVRAKLNRLGLELVGDISHPEHLGIFSTPFRIAARHGIGTLVYGENPQREYSGPLGSEQKMQMNKRWISEFGGLLGMRASDFVGMDGITYRDMADYMLPSEEEMSRIQALFLGQYLPWNSHRNARAAHCGGMLIPLRTPSVANWWNSENLDNAQTGIHDWFGALKFGYGRLCAQISVDIRYGMISRDEAITVVRENDCAFPEYYLDISYASVLEHIGMSEDRFWELARQYANPAIWNASAGRPTLRPEVWLASFE